MHDLCKINNSNVIKARRLFDMITQLENANNCLISTVFITQYYGTALIMLQYINAMRNHYRIVIVENYNIYSIFFFLSSLYSVHTKREVFILSKTSCCDIDLKLFFFVQHSHKYIN